MPRTHQFGHLLLLWGATALCLFLFGPSISAAGARPQQDQTTHTNDHHKQSAVKDQAAREETVKLSIPDLSLLDQQGRKIRFYSDLVKGKTVAINFIFTTCTASCPPLTATFRKVQQSAAERGLPLQLISISVDPTVDTPERLHAFAEKFNAGPGWTFITGDKVVIDSLLNGLGAPVTNKNDHTPMIMIGNDGADYWTRAYGLSSPSQLIDQIAGAAARH